MPFENSAESDSTGKACHCAKEVVMQNDRVPCTVELFIHME